MTAKDLTAGLKLLLPTGVHTVKKATGSLKYPHRITIFFSGGAVECDAEAEVVPCLTEVQCFKFKRLAGTFPVPVSVREEKDLRIN